ncbi:MAG TPA: hypothetical protein IAC31_09910 [Candidatus Faecousia intestinigallinarum]|nr:hypothetical protein [Candidatus Faecousia intestinigallinarum]
MGNAENTGAKKPAFREKIRPSMGKAENVLATIGNILKIIGSWVYRLHKIILAVPVAVAAALVAQYNFAHLPEMVGINLQSNGQYAQMITREMAVLGPVAVTAACLLLMFCSRRTIYPWLISIFSLALPVLVLVTNTFPG